MVTTLSARVLGQRIRQMRTRRGLTQQDLAGEDYSKSYISAIEQGKTRPSLEALQRIASRLEMPAGTLLDPNAPGFAPFDPEALPRRVRRRRGVRAGQGPSLNDPSYIDLRISQAEQLIYSGNPGQALSILRALLPDDAASSSAASSSSLSAAVPASVVGTATGTAASTATATGTTTSAPTRPLDAGQLQRAYFLAAMAAVRHGASAEAIGYLTKGTQAAARQGDREMQEKMRNALGVAFYQADQPLSALEQHKQCQEAIQNGVVTDPNFKLMVYSNLANDYWALKDNEHALATYKTALELLPDVNSMEKQAAIFWDGAMKLADRGQYMVANTAAAKALSLYEGLDNIRLVTRMENRYGDILLEMGDFQSAEGYLLRSLEMADSLNSEVEKATVLTNLARVSIKRNKTAEANERIEQAIALAREAAKDRKVSENAEQGEAEGSETNHVQHKARANKVLARALALAGETSAHNKDHKKADGHFSEAIRIIEASASEGGEIGDGGDESSDIYQRYAQVLAGRGQHEQASKYYEKAYRAATKRH